MKKFMLVPLLLLASASAFANGPWQVFFQNIRLPYNATTGQSILQKYKWVNPALGSGIAVGSTTSLTAGKTLSSFSHQPDFPRNIVIAFTGTTGSIAAGNVVTTGTNIYGKTVTETTAITDGTTKTGATAFASITSIKFPTTTGANGDVTYTITAGAKLGVDRCSDGADDYVFSSYGEVYETTRGTFGFDATHVELNTFTSNSALDGAHDVKLHYLQNFRCYQN